MNHKYLFLNCLMS